MTFEEFRTKLFGMSGLATVEKAFELYSELEAENKRLKAENESLKIIDENLREVKENFEKSYIRKLEENQQLKEEYAKLKCLALHAMSKYFGTMYRRFLFEDRFVYYRDKYSKAYRKAKKELTTK